METLRRTAKIYLTGILSCLAVFGAAFPVSGQTATQTKLSASRQKALDAKLVQTLKEQRHHCILASVQRLVPQGASPNATDWGLPVLMLATRVGCGPEVVKLLIDAGADVNAQVTSHIELPNFDAISDINPLLEATTSEKAAIVRMLLESGANIYSPTACNGSVMEFATTNEIVQIFLDRGLDINAHDKFGMTVLIRSVGVGGLHVPSVAFLLEHGADSNARVNIGSSVFTALRLAQIHGRTNEVELLRKAGATD